MKFKQLEKDYSRIISTMTGAGILTQLPKCEKLGVIGINGEEYPVPLQEQVQEIFSHNQDLVDRKAAQGFTQLQITPLAMPVAQLMEHLKTALIKHAADGRIFQTKQVSTDPDLLLRVNTRAPLWMWERVRLALDTAQFVYFPRTYAVGDHQGLTKQAVIRDTRLCAFPGWSVGLIEPVPVMPRPGQGKVFGGRKQLEANSSPRDYLEILSSPAYAGETGWTFEDFLTHFMIRLETTGQVSDDRYDGNALWLLGSYLPDLMPKALVVPVGYWSREVGRKMYMSAHRTANRLTGCVARTKVRLGA